MVKKSVEAPEHGFSVGNDGVCGGGVELGGANPDWGASLVAGCAWFQLVCPQEDHAVRGPLGCQVNLLTLGPLAGPGGVGWGRGDTIDL